ncbi:MAG: putative Selenoprotein, partial [Pseudomonadota bacterium]
MLKEITSLGQYLGQTARLMVGVPNYSTYVAHQ